MDYLIKWHTARFEVLVLVLMMACVFIYSVGYLKNYEGRKLTISSLFTNSKTGRHFTIPDHIKQALTYTTLEKREEMNFNWWKPNLLQWNLSYFNPLMKKEQFLECRSILEAVVYVLDTETFNYMLSSGTLLGAYRHHTFIPWDADIDIYVDVKHKNKLVNVFNDIQHNNVKEKNVSFNFEFKYKHEYLHRIGSKYRFDIFYYKDNGSHIIDLYYNIIFVKERIFPLQFIPLEGKLYPVPKDVPYVLKKAYNTTDLKHTCNNMAEKDTSTRRHIVSCSHLYPYYPFVSRYVHENKEISSVYINNTLMARFEFILP